MSVIVTFTVPGGDVVFGRAMQRGSLRAELDRVVPMGETSIPFVWVHGDDESALETFEERLTADAAIESVRRLDSFDGRRLYRFRWAEETNTLFGFLRESDAALLEASGTAESWEFELRFPDQASLSTFHEETRRAGVDVDVTGVSRLQPDGHRQYGLTKSQHETLLRALEEGFYDIPRETTTVEFADELGISDQSLSERLRRAHASLIESTLR